MLSAAVEMKQTPQTMGMKNNPIATATILSVVIQPLASLVIPICTYIFVTVYSMVALEFKATFRVLHSQLQI